jgi:hypothetical protein
MALEKNIVFAQERKIEIGRSFASLVVELISRRPNVFADALDSFSELRSLAVRFVHDEFVRCATADVGEDDGVVTVEITLYHGTVANWKTVVLPLAIVRSTSVLLSIWKDEYRNHEPDATNAVDSLVSSIMRTDRGENGTVAGLADSNAVSEQSDAVSVELVSEGMRVVTYQIEIHLLSLSCHPSSGSCWRRLEVILSQGEQRCRRLLLSCLACCFVRDCLWLHF